MAKTKQAAIRRKLAQAVNDCQRATENLLEVASLYEPDHPDMAEALGVTCVSLDMCIEMIGTFSMAAWGRIPEDWEQWRNPRQPKAKVNNATSNR